MAKTKHVNLPLLPRAVRRSRAERIRNGGFFPVMCELHFSNMNRAARRAAVAGFRKSPKGGVGWRVRQWRWGMTHHPRLWSRRFRKLAGGAGSSTHIFQ